MTHAERLLDLVAFLLASRRPVSMERIFEAFPDEYAGEFEARERKFSRDKEALRKLGLPIGYLPPAEEHDDEGYFLDRSRMYMPDVNLQTDEKAALYAVGAAAVKAALPMSDEVSHALVKLRATRDDVEEPSMPAIYAGAARSKHEALLATAAQEHRRVRITYPPGESRMVDPYAVSQRRGRFTIIGFCHLRQEIRTFHADRMTACELAERHGKGGEFTVPDGFAPAEHLPQFPWQIRRGPPIEVRIAFSEALSRSGPRALGIPDDGVCVTTHLDGLLAQVLALGPGATIASPPEARQRLRELLAGLAEDAA